MATAEGSPSCATPGRSRSGPRSRACVKHRAASVRGRAAAGTQDAGPTTQGPRDPTRGDPHGCFNQRLTIALAAHRHDRAVHDEPGRAESADVTVRGTGRDRRAHDEAVLERV